MTKIIPLSEKKIWHCPKCNADLDCSDNLDIAQAIKNLKEDLNEQGTYAYWYIKETIDKHFGEFEE